MTYEEIIQKCKDKIAKHTAQEKAWHKYQIQQQNLQDRVANLSRNQKQYWETPLTWTKTPGTVSPKNNKSNGTT